jgi:hypothetical protein
MSLLLGWLAVAGLINAFVWKAAAPDLGGTLPPLLNVYIYTAQSWRFIVLALAYGLTALGASVGIWHLRRWMVSAFLAWSGVAMTIAVWLTLVARQELPIRLQVTLWPWLVAIAIVMVAFYLYVRGLARGTQRAAL